MHDPKEVFKALPHVQTIWVTKDGEFHLHPANGCERVDRDTLNASPEMIEPIEAKFEPIETPIKLQTGRQVHKRHK